MRLEVLGKTVHFFTLYAFLLLCCNKKLIQKSYYLIFGPSQVKIIVIVVKLLSPEHCQTHILSNLLKTLPHFTIYLVFKKYLCLYNAAKNCTVAFLSFPGLSFNILELPRFISQVIEILNLYIRENCFKIKSSKSDF